MFKQALRHLAVATLIFSAGLTVAPTATLAQDWRRRDRNYQQRNRGWDRHDNRREWRHDDRRDHDWRRQDWRRETWRHQRWNAPYYRGYVPRSGFYFGYQY